MPFKPGCKRPPGAGTKVGQKYKTLRTTVRQRVEEWGCDPFKVMADAAMGELVCSVCRGAGKTKFQPGTGRLPSKGERKLSERVCQSCYGSGREILSPKDRIAASAYLGRYMEPELKAVEIKNALDEAGEKEEFVIKFVE